MTELEKLHCILCLSEEVGVAVHEEVNARIRILADKQTNQILLKQEQKRLTTDDNIAEQKGRFRDFLLKTYTRGTVSSYMSAMNKVSIFVQKYVDVSVQSVFAITERQLMQDCFDRLQQHNEFNNFNKNRTHNRLSAAIEQYILFLS
ncbi:MAG: hypothetical protein ACI4BD_04660 [Paludibacteraceae bacterium]